MAGIKRKYLFTLNLQKFYTPNQDRYDMLNCELIFDMKQMANESLQDQYWLLKR